MEQKNYDNQNDNQTYKFNQNNNLSYLKGGEYNAILA